MIAPIRQSDPDSSAARQRMRRARQVVASTLLQTRRKPVVQAPPIAAWQGWLFAAWVLVVVVAYFGSMLHFW